MALNGAFITDHRCSCLSHCVLGSNDQALLSPSLLTHKRSPRGHRLSHAVGLCLKIPPTPSLGGLPWGLSAELQEPLLLSEAVNRLALLCPHRSAAAAGPGGRSSREPLVAQRASRLLGLSPLPRAQGASLPGCGDVCRMVTDEGGGFCEGRPETSLSGYFRAAAERQIAPSPGVFGCHRCPHPPVPPCWRPPAEPEGSLLPPKNTVPATEARAGQQSDREKVSCAFR